MPSPHLNVKQSTLGASWRMVLTEPGWPTALPAATQPIPRCTHLRNVGYNSAFTKHTIWNARVIPIRPTQATTIFNQCRSGEETHRGCGEQVRTVPMELPGEAMSGTLDFRAGRAGKIVLSDPSIVDT